LDSTENSNQHDDYSTQINNLTVQSQANQAKQNSPDSASPGGDADAPTQFVPPANAQGSNYSGLYPQSSERLLNSNDLNGFTKEKLKIMRNEIFARHGYIFKTADMKNYFAQQNWYKPLYSDVTNQLTSIEKTNVEFIKSYEK
ncbi:MAG: YARHG domain-containing protein, partial [Sphingobacteriales bacterium]